MIDGGIPRTIRLVSSLRRRKAVMAPLADNSDELDLLAEIEGATSGRLVAEERGTAFLPATELVHGVAQAKFINASFAYAKPRQIMRSTRPIAAPGTLRWRSIPASRRSGFI